jgi:haloalkane dehalogenase
LLSANVAEHNHGISRRFPNQQEVTVAGTHFIQEDSPQEITDALKDWIGGLE